MTIAEFCILITALLPYATAAYAKIAAGSAFDTENPRNIEAYQGNAKRAYAAHLNGFEVFPLFALAVLIAEFYQSPQHLITFLACLFIVLRIAYVFAYIHNAPPTRSAFFALGFLAAVGIFLLPLFT